MSVKENQKGSRKSRRFRSLFFSIAATYLTLCLLMVACAFLFLQYSSSSLRSKLEGIAASRAESTASEVVAQMDNFTQLTEVISSSPVLHSMPDLLEKGISDWVPEANRLRAQLITARANYGSAHLSVLGVYYPDAGVFISDSALYTPDMMDYYTAHDTDISLLMRASAHSRDDAAILEDGKCWIIRTIYSRGEACAYVLLRFDLPEFCRDHLNEGDVLCILGNSGIRYSSSADLAMDAIPENSNTGTVQAGKQAYYYKTASPAGLSGVTVLSLVNAEPYQREVMTFIRHFALILGGSVLVMILLAYVFTSRIFLPVRRLLTNLVGMETPAAPSLSSTVDSATSYVKNLSTETEGYRQAARADEYILLGNRLHQLIFFPEEELEEETRKFRTDAGLSPEGSLTVTSIVYDPEAVASMEVGASRLKYFYLERLIWCSSIPSRCWGN